MSSNQMTKEDDSRIQSAQEQGDKDMSSDGFASRAQSAGDKNTNAAPIADGKAAGSGDGGTASGKGSDGAHDDDEDAIDDDDEE